MCKLILKNIVVNKNKYPHSNINDLFLQMDKKRKKKF